MFTGTDISRLKGSATGNKQEQKSWYLTNCFGTGKPFNAYVPLFLKIGATIGLIAGAAILMRIL